MRTPMQKTAPERIRNLSIIAHVDHGKSTLADRILEYTGTVEKRHMREQMLDRMELERERGITIKMQPVSVTHLKDGVPYTLNIIDTPGHIDFSYEVSRSLRAVEGVLLLVDSTQGVQAQTLSVLDMARDAGLTVVPVLTKIDMPHARTDAAAREVADLLGCAAGDIRTVSGKTGEGVRELLDAVVTVVPHPRAVGAGDDPAADARDDADRAASDTPDDGGAAPNTRDTAASPNTRDTAASDKRDTARALVFDFSYTNHTGIRAYARVFGGSFRKDDRLVLREVNAPFTLKDVGIFMPDMEPTGEIHEGMIGYFTTGIKEPGLAVVGDTITHAHATAEPFHGYRSVSPVIWASLYPQSADSYDALHHALRRLRLSDAAFTYEEERSTVLGRGFRCGFLGMLHLEIITERIRREADTELVTTAPSTDYTVTDRNGETHVIATPTKFPDRHEIQSVTEPWVTVTIITPAEYVSAVSKLFSDYEGYIGEVKDVANDRRVITGDMPLRELMRQFFNRLKSITSGYASLSYRRTENRPANVTRLDILLAEEPFPAFSNIVSATRAEKEARELVGILHETIPRTLFTVKIQAKADGKIIASKTLPALRKDVTAKLYGGDITRKMKLREKQKKGKQKMGAMGTVTVPHDIFLKVIRRMGE